jgi:predicted Kef-type K+ transport protein
MFKRLKRGLVESYVGAIALGYLLAESVLYLMYVVAAPVTAWAAQQRYRTPASSQIFWANLARADAIEPLVKFILLLVFWYVLFRWLYLSAPKEGTPTSTAADTQVS